MVLFIWEKTDSVIGSGEGTDYRETQGNLFGMMSNLVLIMLYIFVKTHISNTVEM